MTGWDVVGEVVLLRLDGGRIAHRRVQRVLPSPVALDAVAVDLAQCDGGVCHSTSWRQEDQRLVVTYAVLPDPAPERPAEPLGDPCVAAGPTPTQPSPEELCAADVAAHAVRHLADLAVHDPVVRAAAAREPALWAAVADAARRTAVHVA